MTVLSYGRKKPSVSEILECYSIPVTECGCHIWLGGQCRGYGTVSINGRSMRAHRVAWENVNGKIPKGLHVLHRCDMPPCINPEHLFLGTDADNARDKVNKNRSNKGTKHPLNKLTENQVMEIRSSSGTQVSIARRYGIDQAHVSQIKLRKRWKHLP